MFATCTSSNQCGVGEGDCDVDNDCLGDLLCGQSNCIGGGFDDPDGRLEKVLIAITNYSLYCVSFYN